MNHRSRRVLALLALFFAIYLVSGAAGSGFPDFQDQHKAGERIAEGQVLYRDHVSHLQVYHYPPVYLYTLGGVYALLGPDPLVGKAVLALTSVAVAGVLYLLTRREIGERAAVLTTGLFLLNPLTFSVTYVGYFDNFVVLLVLVAIWFALKGRDGLSGAALSLGFMSKPFPLVLLPLLAAQAYRERGSRAAASVVLSFVAVALAVSAPFLVLAPERYIQYAFLYSFERTGASLSLWYYFLPRVPDVVSVALQTGLAGFIYLRVLRSGQSGFGHLAAWTAALLLGFVLLNRINYPHYLIYVIPFLTPIFVEEWRRNGQWRGLAAGFAVTLLGAAIWSYPWATGVAGFKTNPLSWVGAAIFFLGGFALLGAMLRVADSERNRFRGAG